MQTGSKDRPPILSPARAELETYEIVRPEKKALIDAEVEAVHIILIGIANDIYSTVDACPNAKEIWKAIKRLMQGENINKQDVKTKLNVDTHQVNVQLLLQLQPEWSRFVTIVRQVNDLKILSYHKLFDILKQHHNKVNELRAKRLDKTTNPLALVATTQAQPTYYPQAQPPYHTQALSPRQTTSTRSHAATQSKVGNDRETRHNENQREVVVDGNRKTVKQNERHHTQQPESINDTYVVEKDDRYVTLDSSDMSNNVGEVDQDAEEHDEERVLLASLIKKLELDINESKKNNKDLKKSKASLTIKLEKCKHFHTNY
ncbi:hypothetical protein Tco_0851217 [Tanacetum coccineum]